MAEWNFKVENGSTTSLYYNGVFVGQLYVGYAAADTIVKVLNATATQLHIRS